MLQITSRPTLVRLALSLVLAACVPGPARSADDAIGPEGRRGAHTQPPPSAQGASLTPEERMNRRFPQKVRAGDLVGLPLLDYDDRTLGRVTQVVRTPAGKLVLVADSGGWLGGGRMVPIPIETVAILGRQIALLDIRRDEIPALATWNAGGGAPVGADESIRIAVTRR